LSDAVTKATVPWYNVASYQLLYDDNYRPPPHGGSVWLDEESLWFTFPSMDVTIEGGVYHMPGGTISFPKGEFGQRELLRLLKSNRDLWAPGNAAALIRYAKSFENLK
jgi:hypothetical protein